MPETLPEKRRCRNCKRPFKPSRQDHWFCKAKCRHEYNNYGQTPQAQMLARLKSFLRSDEIREMVREVIREEIQRAGTSVRHNMP